MLEYCSPVWSPVSVSLINQFESMQRRFTKHLPGFQLLPYNDCCARLGIDRLELRRIRADLILCYKIIHGLVLLPCDSFVNIISNGPTRFQAVHASLVSVVDSIFSLFVLSKSGIHCQMLLLQLIVFPCLFVVLNTRICLNLYLVKFNRFAHTCMEC